MLFKTSTVLLFALDYWPNPCLPLLCLPAPHGYRRCVIRWLAIVSCGTAAVPSNAWRIAFGILLFVSSHLMISCLTPDNFLLLQFNGKYQLAIARIVIASNIGILWSSMIIQIPGSGLPFTSFLCYKLYRIWRCPPTTPIRQAYHWKLLVLWFLLLFLLYLP